MQATRWLSILCGLLIANSALVGATTYWRLAAAQEAPLTEVTAKRTNQPPVEGLAENDSGSHDSGLSDLSVTPGLSVTRRCWNLSLPKFRCRPRRQAMRANGQAIRPMASFQESDYQMCHPLTRSTWSATQSFRSFKICLVANAANYSWMLKSYRTARAPSLSLTADS